MPKVYYSVEDDSVCQVAAGMLGEVIRKQHSNLAEAKVSVSVFFIAEISGDGEESAAPCLKFHGYGAAAVIKINSYKDRKEGKADATLIIDKVAWSELDEKERVALLDHEATHLELKCDKHGALLRDDCGRPKLKLRLHDWNGGGFLTIAKKYNESALEVQAIMEVNTQFRQLELNFG